MKKNRMLELAGARPLRDSTDVIREQKELVVEFIGSLQGPRVPDEHRMKWSDFEANPKLKKAWQEMSKEYRKAEKYYDEAQRINIGRRGPEGQALYDKLIAQAKPHMEKAKRIIIKALGHEPAWIGVSPFNNRGGNISFVIDKRKVKGLKEACDLEEAGDYTSPSEMRRLMDTAAKNIEFAKSILKEPNLSSKDEKLAKNMLRDAQALWQSMENLMKQRRRGA